MSTTRSWKALIWHGQDLEQRADVYGESLEALRHAASGWIVEHNPEHFSAHSPNDQFEKRSEYGYSDGTRVYRSLLGGIGGHGDGPLDEGWYYFPVKSYAGPKHFPGVEAAAAHFVTMSMEVERGPDYKHIPLVESRETQYHLIKKIRRVRETQAVNEALQLGWTILSIEIDAGPAPNGEGLAYRHATFVLGHGHEDAP